MQDRQGNSPVKSSGRATTQWAAFVVVALLIAACGQPALPVATTVEPTVAPDPAELVAPTEVPPTPVVLEPANDAADSDAAPVAEPLPISTPGEWADITSNLLGLPSTCGNVSFVTAHPGTDQVFAGVSTHGLWELAPDETEWLPLGNSSDLQYRTAWLEFDPADNERFWVSGRYGTLAAARTDDGGLTYTTLGQERHVDRISVDLSDPDRQTMLMGKHEARIVYLSQDGGATWTDIATTLPEDAGFTSYPQVLDAQTFLLGSYRGDGAGIYRTEDAGATWEQVFAGEVLGTPLIEGDTIIWTTTSGSLVVSEDGGITFDESGASSRGNRQSLIELPNGALAAVSKESVAVTYDRGDSWETLGPTLPFDPKGIAFSEERSALFAWNFTCNFGSEGNPILENSIVQLDLAFNEA